MVRKEEACLILLRLNYTAVFFAVSLISGIRTGKKDIITAFVFFKITYIFFWAMEPAPALPAAAAVHTLWQRETVLYTLVIFTFWMTGESESWEKLRFRNLPAAERLQIFCSAEQKNRKNAIHAVTAAYVTGGVKTTGLKLKTVSTIISVPLSRNCLIMPCHVYCKLQEQNQMPEANNLPWILLSIN